MEIITFWCISAFCLNDQSVKMIPHRQLVAWQLELQRPVFPCKLKLFLKRFHLKWLLFTFRLFEFPLKIFSRKHGSGCASCLEEVSYFIKRWKTFQRDAKDAPMNGHENEKANIPQALLQCGKMQTGGLPLRLLNYLESRRISSKALLL